MQNKKLKFRLPKFKLKLWEQLSKKHQTAIIALVALLFLCWIAKALYQYISGPSKNNTAEVIAQTVRVKEASMPMLVETIGVLTAVKELKIKASSIGRVQSLNVESGSWVREGTLLANIIGAPEVRAPFDGYLTDWLVKSGEYVAPGTELVDLVNTDVLELTYRIPEQFAAKLDIGQTVEVTVKAYPNKVFKGEVHFISPVVDKKTYTILIKAKVSNPEQDLWSGMSAHVCQILETHPKALVAPESALQLTLEGYEVFVVKDGVIEKRAVKIGSRREGRVELLNGVAPFDAIIITRTDAIKEGAKAEAKDWQGEW